MLDEDEERVLQVLPRELEAARNLRQLQRSVAEEAFAHLSYKGPEVVGDEAYGEEDAVLRHHGRQRRGGLGVRILGGCCDGGLGVPRLWRFTGGQRRVKGAAGSDHDPRRRGERREADEEDDAGEEGYDSDE